MTLIAINVLLDLSVSLYQVGDYGVAQRKLYDLHRC